MTSHTRSWTCHPPWRHCGPSVRVATPHGVLTIDPHIPADQALDIAVDWLTRAADPGTQESGRDATP